MNLLYSLAIAVIAGCGVYMMLSRHVVRIVFGLVILSAAINLVIFYAGRVVSTIPPVIPSDTDVLSAGAANPLPQALILTAIVIGFSLIAFVAALALQIHRSIGTLDNTELDVAERLGTPFDEPEGQR